MSSFSSEPTPNELKRRIVRWNLEQCVLGGTFLVCSALVWLLTIYGTIVFVKALRMFSTPWFTTSVSWSNPDALSLIFVAIILAFFTWMGCSSRSMFFVADHPDERFAGIELPEWRLNGHKGIELCWAIPGLAPALTLYGIRVMKRCFSFDKRRIDLACRTYAYLDRWNDWVPYPKLLSQRLAVKLLYHLKLIHVSNRFGKLEIRIRRRHDAFAGK